jgi:hypothetical protein
MDGASTFESVEAVFTNLQSRFADALRETCFSLDAIAKRYRVRSGLYCTNPVSLDPPYVP